MAGALKIDAILQGLQRGADGIYSADVPAVAQTDEMRTREAVARGASADVLEEISDHHSIPVMDREVVSFLGQMPLHAVVADVGGGWGWHWRHLAHQRRDMCIVAVDFVRENLHTAARVLGPLVNEQVFLVHGDATRLPFPAGVFDGYWTVQTFQHTPAFEDVVREAHRVLRPEGRLACYSLNRATAIEKLYAVMGRSYHVRGHLPGRFYLARGTDEDARLIAQVFRSPVTTRYTEILFHPDLGLRTGRATSWAGTVDAHLSTRVPFVAWIARQRSFHTRKRSE